MQLRQQLEQLQAKLAGKDAEVEAAREAGAEGVNAQQTIATAVRAAEQASAQRLAEEAKKHTKAETELRSKLEEASAKVEAAKKRYTSLSEKFAQREDVIVELRARMDEYERGVHGLREEVQEKERFKALHEQRCDEVKKMMLERNRREAMLQELTNEATWLREQCEIKPGDPKYMDLGKLELKSQIELQQMKSTIVAQEDEIEKLEKERTQLLKKLRVKALERGERAAKEGVPVERLAALEEVAADLDDDPDFEGETRVGSGRLASARSTAEALAAQQAAFTHAAISMSFANEKNIEVLRQKGSALQAEVERKGRHSRRRRRPSASWSVRRRRCSKTADGSRNRTAPCARSWQRA